ncbi:HET-domain-containing protein [Ophiobolus disseminans]|uniref:HET-domain-containing protein n=1 Tax=Ophiobolus disseminans TaxID=1469910 RepID=A0A6A6ZVL0_9PLEO|nr:HET-domain-containing protein [Ophiobolus disseminans]
MSMSSEAATTAAIGSATTSVPGDDSDALFNTGSLAEALPEIESDGPVSVNTGSYQYQNLTDAKSIRLLRVDISGNENSFSLIETDTDSAPPYVAISYVWGDPTTKHFVDLANGNVGITESLHFALRDVIRMLHDNNHTLPGGTDFWKDDTVHLWVDALCIDQSNTQEKTVQVPMMTNIFTTAALVVTYMGPKADNSDQGIALVKRLWDFISDQDDHLEGQYRFPPGYDLGELGLPSEDDSSWYALRQLIRRPWPTRVWILQEFLVNKNIILVCGDCILWEWPNLWIIIGACYDSRLPRKHVTGDGDDDIRGQHAIDCLMKLMFLRSGYQDDCKRFSMTALLYYCNQLGNSNPKDKISALLNLANDRDALNIHVDYSPTTSVKDLYTMTTVKIIEHEKLLDILSSVRIDKGYQDEQLPSWVTDWSGIHWGGPRSSVLLSTDRETQSSSSACGVFAAEVSLDANHAELTTRGMIIDEIVPLASDPPLIHLQYWDAKHWAHVEHTILQTGNTIYKTKDGITDALRRSLTFNLNENREELTTFHDRDYNAWWTHVSSPETALSTEERALAVLFEKSIDDTSAGQGFGVTSKGYICVMQDGMGAGDVIAVLRGGQVPYVLRPVEGGKYEFLGEVYVHGLMNGEALLLGDLTEEIVLI